MDHEVIATGCTLFPGRVGVEHVDSVGVHENAFHIAITLSPQPCTERLDASIVVHPREPRAMVLTFDVVIRMLGAGAPTTVRFEIPRGSWEVMCEREGDIVRVMGVAASRCLITPMRIELGAS